MYLISDSKQCMGNKKTKKRSVGRKVAAKTLALSMCVTALQPGMTQMSYAAESDSKEARTWDFANGAQNWVYDDSWRGDAKVTGSTEHDQAGQRLKVNLDYSEASGNGWAQTGVSISDEKGIDFSGYNQLSFDFFYNPSLTGDITIKAVAEEDGKAVLNDQMGSVSSLEAETVEELKKVTFKFDIDGSTAAEVSPKKLLLVIVGQNTDYKDAVYFDNISISYVSGYVNSTVKAQNSTVLIGTDTGLTVNGNTYNYSDSIKLTDPDADKGTKALYQYLKAVGESSSVIYGHMEDVALKAGSTGLTLSDTEDVTGSMSAIDGLDCGEMFKGFAEKYIDKFGADKAKEAGIAVDDTTAADDIKAAAAFSNESIKKGAIMTLSAHMYNFAYAVKRDNADSYEKTYDKYNYTAKDSNELTGDCMNKILPGGEFNDAFTAYLDMIADYASQVNGTILFRPFHENTGSWFWWGKAFCEPETYKNVFKYTVEYLRDEKNIHNILYLYGPGSEAGSEEDYEERYPGDDYVDLVGFDAYADNPVSDDNKYSFKNSFEGAIKLTDAFAKKHGKLFAVTETGIRNGSAALLPKDNQRKEWFTEVLDAVTKTEYNCCYFMLWSNYSSSSSYYTPFVVKKNDDGSLYGHEMLDSFIRFYNNNKSIFASDQKDVLSGLASVKEASITEAKKLSGYITLPVSGSRILDDVKVVAKLNMQTDSKVSLRVSGNGKTKELAAEKDSSGKIYTATLTKAILDEIGETVTGTIGLYADDKLCQEISVILGVKEKEMLPEQIDDFESYAGLTNLLLGKWATNNDSGCTIDISVVESPRYEGNYAFKLEYNETKTGWAGATISRDVDWSAYNALRFWVKPDGKNQKTVVQINSGGKAYEAYLNTYEDYAKTDKELLVTLPFTEFKANDGSDAPLSGEALKTINSAGLWVNAIGDSPAFEDGSEMVNGVLYYDDLRAVTTDSDKPVFADSWETPSQPGNSGNIATAPTGEIHTGVSESNSSYSAKFTLSENYLKEVKDAGMDKVTVYVEKATIDSVKDNDGRKMVVKIKVPQVDGVSVGKVVLTKESITAAAGNTRKLVIRIITEDLSESYIVTIPQSQLKKMNHDTDITVKSGKISQMSSSKKKNINSILSSNGLKTSDASFVSTADSNTKGGLKVTAPVLGESAKTGDNVYVYLYNSKTKKLEEIANNKRTVLKNSTAGFEAYPGNDYVITNKELSGKGVTTLLDKVKISLDKINLKKGGEVNVKVSLPSGLEERTDLKKNVPYGKQAVVITYECSDITVASISKNGKIKAKNAGTTTAIVKIKLADEKTKTIKQDVIVK